MLFMKRQGNLKMLKEIWLKYNLGREFSIPERTDRNLDGSAFLFRDRKYHKRVGKRDGYKKCMSQRVGLQQCS